MPQTREASQTVEEVVRTSYGRLLAFLAARTGDITASEDALGEALLRALTVWPSQGVPEQPEAWLLRIARNCVIDEVRKRRVRQDALPALWSAVEGAQRSMDTFHAFPDERLKLLFACAHPAIDPAVRTPLLLQTVLGFDAAKIASSFLVSPAAMGQRLTRAKAKIRDTRIRFDIPSADELPERLDAVLEAVYAVYGQAWDTMAGSPASPPAPATDALWLARLVSALMPGEPEPLGLLSLILLCESRRFARRNAQGEFVPLAEQDTALWERDAIGEAEQRLMDAAKARRPGRFQVEAAIQLAHTEGLLNGRVEWPAIVSLYDHLLRISPTLGGALGRAAAVAEWQGAAAGLAQLDGLPHDSLLAYQPYWALRAHLLRRLNRPDEARHAYDVAIGLTEDIAVRRFLQGRRDAPSEGAPSAE